MKKILTLSLALLFTLSCCLSAAAAQPNGRRSIKDLKANSSHWQQTYQAYGRTINIDAEIEIPDVESAPVLRAARWFPVTGDEAAKWEQYFAKPDKNPHTYYEFKLIPEQGTTYFEYNMNEEYSSEKWRGKIQYGLRGDPHADWAASYAEDHPLNMREAFEFVQKKLNLISGREVPLYPLHGAGWDTPRLKRTGKRLFDHGKYELHLTQEIRGMPVMANVDNLYYPGNGPALGDVMPVFGIDTIIYDEESYRVFANLIQETGVIHNDIPLLPFEAVKPVVEDLIKRGLIRDIYTISLCYIPFHDADDLWNSFILVPVWGITCEFMRTADQDPYSGAWSEAYWHSDTCRQIAINAQTGQLFDPFSTDEHRLLSPDIIPWP